MLIISSLVVGVLLMRTNISMIPGVNRGIHRLIMIPRDRVGCNGLCNACMRPVNQDVERFPGISVT